MRSPSDWNFILMNILLMSMMSEDEVVKALMIPTAMPLVRVFE